MTHRSLLVAAVVTAGACARPPAAPPPAAAPAAKPFEMRSYFLALLRRGPAWTRERTPAVEALGRGHMANIRRLGAEGKLVIAGPFVLDESAPRDAIVGIFVFDVPTREEALALVRTDPAIAAGHFSAAVLEWLGPRGLTFDGREAELEKIRRELGVR